MWSEGARECCSLTTMPLSLAMSSALTMLTFVEVYDFVRPLMRAANRGLVFVKVAREPSYIRSKVVRASEGAVVEDCESRSAA